MQSFPKVRRQWIIWCGIFFMLVEFLFRMLARLPLTCLYRLGGVGGWLVYLCSPAYRRCLRANLTQAVGDPSRALLHRAIAEAGRQALEICWIWLRPLSVVLAQVKAVYGLELLEKARLDGRGILFVTPHLGCFELAAHYCAHAGNAPLTVLYRPPRYRALEPLMQAGRVRGSVKTAPADLGGVKQLLKALRGHDMVGILPDQAPRAGEGVWTEFFGRPAWTMTLGARLAEVRGVQTIYVWVERLPRGRGYAVHYSLPAENCEGDLVERCAAMNREVERLVRQCPAQYLWAYNRYKRPRGVPAPETKEMEA
ncbi:MAG: lysophospholipid acyltransferase family protein [Azoarcus sp.]|jgi:KDO2-lipid IV(A) lauroyltransferase|nr:lysophospholipid acyltransferase family protein [Azoarcus sp.]